MQKNNLLPKEPSNNVSHFELNVRTQETETQEVNAKETVTQSADAQSADKQEENEQKMFTFTDLHRSAETGRMKPLDAIQGNNDDEESLWDAISEIEDELNLSGIRNFSIYAKFGEFYYPYSFNDETEKYLFCIKGENAALLMDYENICILGLDENDEQYEVYRELTDNIKYVRLLCVDEKQEENLISYDLYIENSNNLCYIIQLDIDVSMGISKILFPDDEEW